MASSKPPGFLSRIGAAAKLVATGKVDNTTWFGPLEPLNPVAPPEVAGRRYDYRPGLNIITQPRGDERTSFVQLRALADSYDLLRLVIETRKDQLAKLNWTIQPRDKTKKGQKDSRLTDVTNFFERPDRENNWDVWTRMIVEDMLVIDAATIFPRRTIGGQLYSFELIDGATIKPIFDDHARRPLPPDTAFQQNLHGLPAVDYTSQDIYYLPRNLRTHRDYGFPPVEQVIMTVNIAMRRQIHQLEFYTSGTVPDMIMPVPDNWTPQQIEDFQSYWDALLTDNLAERRRVRFVPASIGKGAVQTKEAALKDEYDEWLARIVCYAFSVSPQWAVKQMNRATAGTAQETAIQEGLAPLQIWLKNAVDRCIAEGFGYPDLELSWAEEEDVDPVQQMTVVTGYAKIGAKTINEIRALNGDDPIDGGDTALIYTAQGAITLDSVLNPPEPPPIAGIGHNGGPPLDDPAAAAEQAGGSKAGSTTDKPVVDNKMAKAAGSRPVKPLRMAARQAKTALAQIWTDHLAAEGKRLAAGAARLGDRSKMAKAAGDEDDPLDSDAWAAAGDATSKVLEQLAAEGAAQGEAAIGVSTSLANPRAVQWAKDHAVSLVNDLEGTTRDALAATIAQGEAEGWSVAQLGKAIEENHAFSPDRAQLIAAQETRTADNQGNLIAWQSAKSELGLNVMKAWVTRGANICAECEANEADGPIPVDEAFTSGDDTAPAHVNCECDVEPVLDETPDEVE